MIEHVKPTARIPAVQGQFGTRLVTYTTQLPAGAIETILGHDPRSRHWKQLSDDVRDIYEKLQRATTPKRLDGIVRYIRYRFIERGVILGAFPAIAIAVEHPTEFEPYAGISDSGVGVLHFDLSRRNRRIMVDGLGRASAAMELVELSESSDLSSDARAALQKLISEFALPTVFYVPAPGKPSLTIEEMGQLFHDFNFKVQAVPERVAIALDHSDLYIGLTNKIAQSEAIMDHGGMERKAASLGRKSTAIVVQQNLLRFVRGATEGESFLEAKNNTDLANPNLTPDNLSVYQDKIEEFLSIFATSMSEEAFKDKDSLHLTSPGWGALGILFHDLFVRLKVPDLDAAARKLGTLDWRRSADMWADLVRERKDKNGAIVLGLGGGGAQTRRAITRIAREYLGIDKLLSEREFEESPEVDEPDLVEEVS
jgi:hypothetical protein